MGRSRQEMFFSVARGEESGEKTHGSAGCTDVHHHLLPALAQGMEHSPGVIAV